MPDEGPRPGQPRRHPPRAAVRLWSGKTVDQHRTDRAQVVRETLLAAGIEVPELDRMAASVTLADGSPRFVWTDTRPDHETYVKIILNSIGEGNRTPDLRITRTPSRVDSRSDQALWLHGRHL